MKELVLEIPDDLVPPEEQVTRLHQELAIRLYQKGILSFGKACQLTGMTKWEFHSILGEEGIVRHYDVEEMEKDLATLEALD